MKRNLLNIAVLSAACLVGCKSEQPVQNAGKCDYKFEAITTKALIGETCIEWEAGDKIGTFAGGLNNGESAITIGEPCTFNVQCNTPLVVGDNVYAYYPYSAQAGTSASAVTMNIPAAQTIDASGFDADAMPQAAVPYTVTASLEAGTTTPVAGMHFRNLASVIEFNLYADGSLEEGEKIQSVTIQSESDICGTYTVDLTSEEAALVPSQGGKTITVTLAEPVAVPSTKDDAYACKMVVAPGEFAYTIVVKTDKAEYFKTVASKTYAVNGVKPLSLNVATATKAVLAFEDASAVTFNYGEQKEFAISNAGVTDVEALGNGWTAEVNENTVTVTAPTRAQVSVDGETPAAKAGTATLALQGTSILGTQIEGANTKALRLRGINNADELAAFTTAYGNSSNTPVTSGDTITPYLVDGELALNADITIPSKSIAYGAYWLKRLYIPLNGNNHTLTITTKQANRGGLFQNLFVNVHDLKIAGTMETTASGATAVSCMGSLSSYIGKNGLLIENVSSTVSMTYKSYVKETTAGYVAGIIGCAGDVQEGKIETFTMKNCHFNGSITLMNHAIAVGGIFGQGAYGMHGYFENCTSSANITATTTGWMCYVGGIVGSTGTATNPGEIMTITDCSYSGTITYKQNNQYNSRFGGILGNLERGAELTRCTFTGAINVDQNNKESYTGTDRGIGGLVGRDVAPNTSYPNMNAKADITDCNAEGTITVTNSKDTDANVLKCVNRIVGCQKNTTASHVETRCTATTVITVNGVVRQ